MGEIAYGTTTIRYVIQRRDRNTIGIEVHPDQHVIVLAPHRATDKLIHSKVEKRASWITKQIRFFERNRKPEINREWVSGENFYYLGRQYRLKIQKGDPGVKLTGKFLTVTCPDKNDIIQIEKLVTNWLKHQAKLKFADRLERQQYILQREKITMNHLMIRKIQNRWGSCTKKGNIVLNIELIHAPVNCIDYVIIHELCHLKHHNHGPKFWRMLGTYCEDWSKRKNKLNAINK